MSTNLCISRSACFLFMNLSGLMQRQPSECVVGENKSLFNSRLRNTSIVNNPENFPKLCLFLISLPSIPTQ